MVANQENMSGYTIVSNISAPRMKSSLMTEFFFCSPAIVTPAQVGISILKTRNCVEMSFTFNQADTDAAFLRPRVPRSERRSMPGAVEYSLCYGAMTVLPFVS
jgi:hypothetical protein